MTFRAFVVNTYRYVGEWALMIECGRFVRYHKSWLLSLYAYKMKRDKGMRLTVSMRLTSNNSLRKKTWHAAPTHEWYLKLYDTQTHHVVSNGLSRRYQYCDIWVWIRHCCSWLLFACPRWVCSVKPLPFSTISRIVIHSCATISTYRRVKVELIAWYM